MRVIEYSIRQVRPAENEPVLILQGICYALD